MPHHGVAHPQRAKTYRPRTSRSCADAGGGDRDVTARETDVEQRQRGTKQIVESAAAAHAADAFKARSLDLDERLLKKNGLMSGRQGPSRIVLPLARQRLASDRAFPIRNVLKWPGGVPGAVIAFIDDLLSLRPKQSASSTSSTLAHPGPSTEAQTPTPPRGQYAGGRTRAGETPASTKTPRSRSVDWLRAVDAPRAPPRGW